jgi:hypothetical protein
MVRGLVAAAGARLGRGIFDYRRCPRYSGERSSRRFVERGELER